MKFSDVAVAGQSSSSGQFATLPPMPDNLYPRPSNAAPTVYHIVEVFDFSNLDFRCCENRVCLVEIVEVVLQYLVQSGAY